MNKLIFIIVVIFIFTGSIYADTKKFEVKFSDCVDGDTFKVLIDEKEYSVRLLAIDTPETVKPGSEVENYGKEASDYTCDKVTSANKIELEYDDGSDEKDKYDRILAWVYVDGDLLQNELISVGYAEVAYIYGDYKYTNDLYALEDTAKINKTGMWSDNEKISSTEEISTTNSSLDEESLWNQIQDLINDYIEKWIKDLIKDLNSYIKKAIKEVFD